MEAVLAQRLILTICAVTFLAFAARQKWVTAKETSWIGAALIFCSTGWNMAAVLNVTRSSFASHTQAILTGIALIVPLDLALIIGLVFLVRSLKQI